MKAISNDVLLIDFNNTLMRSMAVNKELAHRGQMTGGFYGFVIQLCSMINYVQPEHVIICDDKRPYFREAVYSKYKGDREKSDDADGFYEALSYNKGWCKEFIKMMNIPILSETGYEADDWIGYITKTYADKFDRIIVASNDTDLYQLFVYPNFMVYKRKGGKTYLLTKELFTKEYYPVKAEDFNFYTALVGSHNNFPGIKGIGDKTVKKMMLDPFKLSQIKVKHKEHLAEAEKILPLPYPGMTCSYSEEELFPYHHASETALTKFLATKGITVTAPMVEAFQFYR